MHDEFGLLTSIKNGLDENQETELEEISIEPQKKEAIISESEMPIA